MLGSLVIEEPPCEADINNWLLYDFTKASQLLSEEVSGQMRRPTIKIHLQIYSASASFGDRHTKEVTSVSNRILSKCA